MTTSLNAIFQIIVPLTYWVIVLIWSCILYVFLRRVGRLGEVSQPFKVLIVVLTLDAGRTLFENLYFGIYFNSLFGFIPQAFQNFLKSPVLLAIPKLVNGATGLLVLFLLLRRWLPDAELERTRLVASLQASLAENQVLTHRYRRIIDTSPDVICALDRQGRFLDVGERCRDVLGLTPADLLGHTLAEYAHPDDRDELERRISDAAQGRMVNDLGSRFKLPQGSDVPILWSFAWSAEDARIYAVGRDQSQRLALESELQQSQRLDAIGKLTGGVAHDFNNLLTVILGCAEQLSEALQDNAVLRPLAELAHAAAARGAQLTQRLLAFARRQTLLPKPTDLNTLLAGMADLLRHALGERIHIERSAGADLWPAQVDPLQLENVVLNLCLNARDAMPDGGTLRLTTDNVTVEGLDRSDLIDLPPGRYVRLQVSDTGSGIAPAHLERIFEPFFTTKEQGKGTGLGLAMVYGFTKQSNGHVMVRSELGAGTTFSLYLPHADPR